MSPVRRSSRSERQGVHILWNPAGGNRGSGTAGAACTRHSRTGLHGSPRRRIHRRPGASSADIHPSRRPAANASPASGLWRAVLWDASCVRLSPVLQAVRTASGSGRRGMCGLRCASGLGHWLLSQLRPAGQPHGRDLRPLRQQSQQSRLSGHGGQIQDGGRPAWYLPGLPGCA